MQEVTFAELGVSTAVIRALADNGIEAPFAVQNLVVPDGLLGRDVLARSKTGSGKTLAFAIPIVELLKPGQRGKPAALVLVPTRELAVQVVRETQMVAKAKDLRVAAAYGGVSIHEQSKAVNAADILVATPGRLEDLLQRRLVKVDAVTVLVLDEADRMLDMGFLPQVDAIVRRLPKERQTYFLSATLDGEVQRLSRMWTRDPVKHELEPDVRTVEGAEHEFVKVGADGKVAALAEIIGREPGLTLVFVRTKRGADRLVHRLKGQGVEASAMHGDMTQQAREKALKRFTNGTVKTLVATDVAARGLDVEGITHVVNYDPPEDDKGYVHRVGRTARAGRTGVGVTLVLPEQQGDVSRMAARLNLAEDFTESGMQVAPPRLVYSSKRGHRSQLHRVGSRRR